MLVTAVSDQAAEAAPRMNPCLLCCFYFGKIVARIKRTNGVSCFETREKGNYSKTIADREDKIAALLKNEVIRLRKLVSSLTRERIRTWKGS